MRLPRRTPAEQVEHLLRIYRDPAEGDGVNGARGILALAAIWLTGSLAAMVIVYLVFVAIGR